MSTVCHNVVLLLLVAFLASCVTSRPEIVQTHWGRCGELAKTQYFSSDATRRLEKEVFYGLQNKKMLELHCAPPIVEVRTFDKKGKVVHLERRNLSHLAHTNRGRPDFELLYFPVVSHTGAGYTRVDYFDYICCHPDGHLDTVVYFHKDKYPEDPFDKIKNGMTRQEVHHLAGKPVLSGPKQNREQYYSGMYTITIEYEGDNVTKVKSERRKKYQ